VLRASAIIEKAGVPSVSLVCDGFTGQAKGIRGGLGVPTLPTARIVGHVDSQSLVEMQDNVRRFTVADVARCLTEAPPSATDDLAPISGAANAIPETDPAQTIIARGSFEDINTFFEEKQWSDGLPIVPPTEEKVAAFLEETPDEATREIGVLQPSGRLATIHNVAVNGVMANCRPEHMPVLVAIAETLAEPIYGVEHSGDTTGGEALVILSGPAASDLGFNSEGAALRDGYRANTSVGRFVRLLLRNVACSLPESTDKSTFGNTWRVVLAEQISAVGSLGWPGLSEDQGFGASDTTVTVARYTGGGVVGSIFGRKAVEILPYLADGLVRQMSWELAFTVGFAAGKSRPLLVLSPLVAQTLAADGVDKTTLRKMLFEHARLPAIKLETYIGPWGNLVPGGRSLNQLVEDGLADPLYAGDNPNRLVPIAVKPEHFMIVVAGDPLRSNAYAFGHNGMHGFPVSKKVRRR
jgi:hypothetical protein